MRGRAAIAIGLLTAAVICGAAAAPVDNAESDARARELIRLLHLQVLPKESGYLGIIGKSAQVVPADGRPLAVQSQNYYMLTRAHPINFLHWLASDDTHILIEGGPVDYFIFHPDGRAEKVTLGMDLAGGERPVVAVPGGCWKALSARRRAVCADGQYAFSGIHARPGKDWGRSSVVEALCGQDSVGERDDAAGADRAQLEALTSKTCPSVAVLLGNSVATTDPWS
jgi:predicted cupin superfamily sugar epimerase